MAIKHQRKTGFFVSPLIYIAALLFLLVAGVLVGLYFFPEWTIVSIVLMAIILRGSVKKKDLTFFEDYYAPDGSPEDFIHIEDVRDHAVAKNEAKDKAAS